MPTEAKRETIESLKGELARATTLIRAAASASERATSMRRR